MPNLELAPAAQEKDLRVIADNSLKSYGGQKNPYRILSVRKGIMGCPFVATQKFLLYEESLKGWKSPDLMERD